jgi:hypothetical protein
MNKVNSLEEISLKLKGLYNLTCTLQENLTTIEKEAAIALYLAVNHYQEYKKFLGISWTLPSVEQRAFHETVFFTYKVTFATPPHTIIFQGAPKAIPTTTTTLEFYSQTPLSQQQVLDYFTGTTVAIVSTSGDFATVPDYLQNWKWENLQAREPKLNKLEYLVTTATDILQELEKVTTTTRESAIARTNTYTRLLEYKFLLTV